MGTRDVALIVLVANAPMALVLLAAVLRGYRVDLHLSRGRRDE